jgi:hypothetical protein
MTADRYIAEGTIEPFQYVQLTDLGSAVGVGSGGGRVALIQSLNQNVRWRDDGSNPTTSVGMRLHAGETMLYTGNLRNLKFIEEAAGAELNISLYE